jgi:hypothetical protein
VNPKYLIGFLHEFTVRKKSGTGELKYKVRTVVSKENTADLSLIKSEPVELDGKNTHPRGTWAYSSIVTEIPIYEVGGKEAAFTISNGQTDNLFSAKESFERQYGVIDNIGHFGVTYKVRIPLENHTGEPKTVRLRINARGGRYAGAFKTINGNYISPEIDPFTEVANVMDYVVEEEEDEIEFELMHAGGSSLPLAIDIITLEELEQELLLEENNE